MSFVNIYDFLWSFKWKFVIVQVREREVVNKNVKFIEKRIEKLQTEMRASISIKAHQRRYERNELTK